MAFTLFDWLNEITYSKRPWNKFTDEEKSTFNTYMINRFISMDSNYIDVVNLIQRYPNCSNKWVYKFYCDMLPKKKSFFRYIKSKIKWDKETVDKIADYYKCSTREAKEYISILRDDQLEDILNVGTSSTNKKRRNKK
jgi:hypothetical protein